MPHPILRAHDLTIAQGGHTIVSNLTLDIPTGKFTAIIGPNGCGKSTLLRTLARILTPAAGHVELDGKPLTTLPSRVIAQSIGLLPQAPSAPVAMRVADLVARGRTPHQRLFSPWSHDDQRAVTDALDLTHLTDLSDAPLHTLSGGQRQRAWIAMVLAQETPLLLLDEPTTYLDLAHQVEVLGLLRGLTDRGKTIVAVLHDLNLTARHADHIVAMRDGRIQRQGPPDLVLTQAAMADVFDLDCTVIPDPLHGTPMVIPR